MVTVFRGFHDRGDGAVSYLGVIGVVAGITMAVVGSGIGGTVAGGVESALCRVAQSEGRCGTTEAPAAAAAPAAAPAPARGARGARAVPLPQALSPASPTPSPTGILWGTEARELLNRERPDIVRNMQEVRAKVFPPPPRYARAAHNADEERLSETLIYWPIFEWLSDNGVKVAYAKVGGNRTKGKTVVLDVSSSEDKRMDYLFHAIREFAGVYTYPPARNNRSKNQYVEDGLALNVDNAVAHIKWDKELRDTDMYQQLKTTRSGDEIFLHARGTDEYWAAYNSAVGTLVRSLGGKQPTEEEKRIVGERAGRRKLDEMLWPGESQFLRDWFDDLD